MDALLFELAGARYALAIVYGREVVRAVLVDPLPHTPHVVAGVINYRGQVPSRAVAPEDHFLVVEALGRCLALHVDVPLDLAQVTPVPLTQVASEQLLAPGSASYIAGAVPTYDGVLLIQDLPAFLSPDELVTLDRALADANAGCGV